MAISPKFRPVKQSAGWQPSPADNLCQAVELPWQSNRVPNFEGLIEGMRAANARQSGSGIPAPGGRVAIPFRDVVIKDRNEPDHFVARALKSVFDSEFASTGAEMAAHCAQDAAMEATTAYFGHGVFAPVRTDTRVADLDFCWAARPDAAESQTPKLGAGAGAQEAAWYAGQNALALGFVPNAAPALLRLPSGLKDEPFFEQLRRTRLFIGRRTRNSSPKIELHPIDSGGSLAFADAPDEWWMKGDGRWQELTLTIGNQSHKLWMRLTNRTGCINFTPASPNADLGIGEACILVRGILLPTLRILPSFSRRWHSFPRTASRWMVHFDGRSRLRGSELGETAVSVVCDSLVPFAVYHHDSGKWSGLRDSIDSRQSLPLGGGVRIEHCPFPRKLYFSPDIKINNDSEHNYSKIYGRDDWMLLNLADFAPFGRFEVAHGRVLPMPETGGVEAGDIGFDWVNRAAQVSLPGPGAIGLADYWSRCFRVSVDDNQQKQTLDVTVVPTGRKPVTYTIRAGDRGIIGPLYVEFCSP